MRCGTLKRGREGEGRVNLIKVDFLSIGLLFASCIFGGGGGHDSRVSILACRLCSLNAIYPLLESLGSIGNE